MCVDYVCGECVWIMCVVSGCMCVWIMCVVSVCMCVWIICVVNVGRGGLRGCDHRMQQFRTGSSVDCGWRVGASLLEHCNWLPARARVRRGRGHSGTAQPQARAGGRGGGGGGIGCHCH